MSVSNIRTTFFAKMTFRNDKFVMEITFRNDSFDKNYSCEVLNLLIIMQKNRGGFFRPYFCL